MKTPEYEFIDLYINGKRDTVEGLTEAVCPDTDGPYWVFVYDTGRHIATTEPTTLTYRRGKP